MGTIQITLPSEILEIVKSKEELKILLAIEMWEEGLISFEKAAELCGLSIETFMEMISLRGKSIFRGEVIKEDIETVKKI